jgi:hypothetical protein
VGGRVFELLSLIIRLADDLLIEDDDRTDGHVASSDSVFIDCLGTRYLFFPLTE